jgi:hypothetical protein
MKNITIFFELDPNYDLIDYFKNKDDVTHT